MGDEGHSRLRAGDGLVEAEEQREVAMNAFFFKHFRSTDAGPRGSDLDQNPVMADAGLIILGDNAARLGNGGLGVEGEPRIDLGGDPAGDDFENALAESHREALEGQFGHIGVAGVIALLVTRFFENAVDKLLIMRHLRSGRDERGVGGGVGGAEFFHRLKIAGVGDHRGVLPQLLEQILRHENLLGSREG